MHQHPIGPDHSVNKVVTRNSSSFFVSFNPRCTWDCSTLACLIYTIQYPFKTNILQFLIRFNLQPANAYYIWKVRAIYHRFDGILPKTHPSTSFPGAGSENGIPQWTKKMLFMAIWGRNNLIFTKTERKEMQEYANHVALYGIIYILFEKHLREKQVSVYIMKPCGEIGQGFEESLRGGKLVLTA